MLRCLKLNSFQKLSSLYPEINELSKNLPLNILFKFAPILKNTKLTCGQMNLTFPNNSQLPESLSSQIQQHTHVSIPANQLIQAVLTDVCVEKSNYGKPKVEDNCLYIMNGEIHEYLTRQNVIIEFSSPNIAKPFHAGHLRSTVIGQFLVNINKWFGQNVTSLNYLGDWGTQFGYIAEGFKKYGSNKEFESDAVHHLFEVYVKMHSEGDKDPSVHHKAMLFFRNLEQGDQEAKEFWQKCRDVSEIGYNGLYKRLNIRFDGVLYESMFSQTSMDIINILKNKNALLFKQGVGYVNVMLDGDDVNSHQASLVKSDGSSLYLTRDIASALYRYKEFKADKMYYVVENGQHQHFKLLRGCLKNYFDLDLNEDMHVKFGRVEGMSTRKGAVVWLEDVVNEARSIVKERMLARSTTKVSYHDVDTTAEALAVAAVIINDLKQSRMNNYKFDWNEALNFNGNTGIFLQYTHARLHSLIEKAQSHFGDGPHFDPELLTQDIALKLCQHLARFDEVLLNSHIKFEACILVHYLFNLGRLVNLAHSELRIIGQTSDIAQARLILFESAKQVLTNGMKLLGLTPLDKI